MNLVVNNNLCCDVTEAHLVISILVESAQWLDRKLCKDKVNWTIGILSFSLDPSLCLRKRSLKRTGSNKLGFSFKDNKKQIFYVYQHLMCKWSQRARSSLLAIQPSQIGRLSAFFKLRWSATTDPIKSLHNEIYQAVITCTERVIPVYQSVKLRATFEPFLKGA